MKILIADDISADGLNYLSKSDVQFDYLPKIDQSELLKTIGSYDALIVRSRTKVTAEVLSRASRLKVVGRPGVGLDNVDIEKAKALGIKVVNTPDALTNAVAEFTLGLMISLARSIAQADASLRSGKWLKSSLTGSELKGKIYGTIGIGRIGHRVAQLARSFGMRVVANDVIPIPDNIIKSLDVRMTSQEEVFRESDFVDLHVPLTSETTYLVNYDKLSKMKRTAFLINTSRGKIVNEQDLLRGLNEGLIAGAALDVFESEPYVRAELTKNSRLVLTPHIAGQTEEAQAKAALDVVEAVVCELSAT